MHENWVLHEIPLSCTTLRGIDFTVQVDPPLMVDKICARSFCVPLLASLESPTATQNSVVAQETPGKSVSPEGIVWVIQVLPPSVVLPMLAGALPDVTHTKSDGHDTLS
jgi:hypothetical protein